MATLLRIDIRALFHNRYESVADFKQKTGIQMPQHIAAMLNPQNILRLITADGIPNRQLGTLLRLNRSDDAFRELQREIRLKLALKGYETHELSTGIAAHLAGMSRAEFMSVIGEHGIPLIWGI